MFLILFIIFCSLYNSSEGMSECRWSQWGPWTQCSQECGGGKQFRAKANNGKCGQWPNNRQEEARICNAHRCPQGKTGPKGLKGPRGDRGPIGPRGEAGKSEGARGPVGDAGKGKNRRTWR